MVTGVPLALRSCGNSKKTVMKLAGRGTWSLGTLAYIPESLLIKSLKLPHTSWGKNRLKEKKRIAINSEKGCLFSSTICLMLLYTLWCWSLQCNVIRVWEQYVHKETFSHLQSLVLDNDITFWKHRSTVRLSLFQNISASINTAIDPCFNLSSQTNQTMNQRKCLCPYGLSFTQTWYLALNWFVTDS